MTTLENREQLGEVRRMVRALLEDTQAFQAMEPEDRRQVAKDLVTVLSFLTDANGGLPSRPARALEELGSNQALKDRLAKDQKLVGQDFKAGAAHEAATVFKRLVTAVNFPAFVSNLIDGVYKSIVSSSIQQMEAYGKLLANVVKSVQQFAQDNISLEDARDFVQASFPKEVKHDRKASVLVLKDGAETTPDFRTVLGMDEDASLDDADSELKIVLAAQLKLARQRQQQLATMVMLGINRIVVTDGEIKASVLFDVKSKDTAQRTTEAYTDDTTSRTEGGGGGGWFSDPEPVDTRVSSAYSEEKEKSTAELDARAKLSGSVTVRFKSETFPLERLASPAEIGTVQERGTRR